MKINYTSSDIKNKILKCLREKTKFSLLRIGDGEMIIANNITEKLKPFLDRQIGREMNESELITLRNNITESVLNSTVLGLPTSQHIKKNMLWESILSYYEIIKTNNPEKWGDKKYCSIDIHLKLLESGDLFEVFNYINRVVIVSPRDIRNQLKEKFPNIIEIEYYSLPAEQKFEPIKNTKINIMNRINEIRDGINSKDRSGELLIFGAGPFGKILGSDFYKKNGVSLDLGSVFDLFVGKVTRGKHKGPHSTIKPLL
jgi:hypothetical protein